MINIEQFSSEFNKRHDFEYEDINFLPIKYQHISFKDIPEAWVCLIDNCLRIMEDVTKISSISQYYGLLIVSHADILHPDLDILNDLENNIRLLDLDLHEQLEKGIGQH